MRITSASALILMLGTALRLPERKMKMSIWTAEATGGQLELMVEAPSGPMSRVNPSARRYACLSPFQVKMALAFSWYRTFFLRSITTFFLRSIKSTVSNKQPVVRVRRVEE